MNLTEWREQGVILSQEHNTQKWALADWLATGDTAWGGSAYNTAQELFPHLSRKYLMTVAYVGRNVASPLRKDKLSFAHHELVAALEPVEQERALQKALEDGLNVTQLKKYLRDVVLKESPFSIPFNKELFAQLDQFARIVKISPEALVNRAVQLFLANPPADLAATYQKEVEAEREKRRLAEERNREQEASQQKRYEQWQAAEKEFDALRLECEASVRSVESPLKQAHADEFRAFGHLLRAQPRPDAALVRERLAELLALADKPTAAVEEGATA